MLTIVSGVKHPVMRSNSVLLSVHLLHAKNVCSALSRAVSQYTHAGLQYLTDLVKICEEEPVSCEKLRYVIVNFTMLAFSPRPYLSDESACTSPFFGAVPVMLPRVLHDISSFFGRVDLPYTVFVIVN